MSAYGPAGFSWSLNFNNSLVQMKAPPVARIGGNRAVVLAAWAIMRLSLGVIYGMVSAFSVPFIESALR
jgi:hypothetical protein